MRCLEEGEDYGKQIATMKIPRAEVATWQPWGRIQPGEEGFSQSPEISK